VVFGNIVFKSSRYKQCILWSAFFLIHHSPPKDM
jgi:hypothetical protein